MSQYYDYNAKMRVPDRLFTPLHGVRLTEGPLREVFDNNIRFIGRLDMDRMRYWFDVKQGREPQAERYPGHFEDNLKGQTASQYLMGAGNVLRFEQEDDLRRGLDQVVDFIEEAADPDGFLMPVDQRNFAYKEYPHYVRIWLTYGLIAAARAGNPKAFPLLRRWQDWFNRCPDLPVIKYLELAFQGVVASPSVFVTEVGDDPDMLICRTYYEETWRLAQFIARERDCVHIRRQPGHEPHPHGSELEAFEGYIDLYRYTGAPYLLNAVLGCWELYKRDWQHPGGGIIMCEAAPEAHPGCNYFYKEYHYNELCCTSFWMHMNQRLHRLFPEEEKYVFEMEQSLYNVAIANQNGDIDIRYFALLDDHKKEPERLNHCCSGVGTRIFGSLPEYLFTLTGDTLSCDLYAGAVLDWQTPFQTIRVTEDTKYPYEGKIGLSFAMEQPQEFTLRLRIPHYAAGEVPVLLNGEALAQGTPGTFLALHRQWQPGDTLSFEIPMRFETIPYQGDNQVEGYDRFSYLYGPLLMAVVGERSHPNGIVVGGTGEDFAERLRPDGRGPLCFSPEGEPGVTVMPYMDIQDEGFSCFPMFEK